MVLHHLYLITKVSQHYIIMRGYVLLTVNNGTTPQSLHYPYFRHEYLYTSIGLHVPLTAGRFLGPEAASLCRLLVTVWRVVTRLPTSSSHSPI